MKEVLAVFLFAALVSGCTLFDKGKLDLPYDASIVLSLPSGDALVAYTDDDGIHVSGQYVSLQTGIVYKVDPDGTISATWTDPATGQVQSITLKPRGN